MRIFISYGHDECVSQACGFGSFYAEKMHEKMRRLQGKKAHSFGVLIITGVVYLVTTMLIIIK